MPPGTDNVEYCCDGINPDDIVITGISGRFPKSDNVGELCEGIYSKKDLFSSLAERWEIGSAGVMVEKGGLINDATKFDNEFFSLPAKYAHHFDPMQRILLEVTYEAIVDSGYDPEELRGGNIGVYCAVNESEGKSIAIIEDETQSAKGVGYVKSMIPNRCSHYFDFHGPSVCLDTACSSSAMALYDAVTHIRNGAADAAIVSGCQLLLNPEFYGSYLIGGMSSEKSSIPFDANSGGLIRSEAIAAIFIQKASSARRIYSTISNIRMHTAGHVSEGIYVPSSKSQIHLLEEAYKDIGLNYNDTDYVEAHGTGTFVGDPIELKSIAAVFCKGRKKPLYVGTVKSSIGHTETVAGICGYIHAILAFETGKIPPNLNFEVPNPACPELVKGDMIVATDAVPFTSSYISVSSFGFGGVNAHTILKKNSRECTQRHDARKIPRLVLYPATTEEGIQYMFDYLHKTPLSEDYFNLLNNLSFSSTIYKGCRGYTILKDNDQHISEIKMTPQRMKPVWYIMTGMGCQWPGMSLSLMEIDVFAKSMKKSAKVIKPLGIDLFEILRADKNYLQQDRCITPAFVAIAAIQIALIDLLTYLDIQPDGIIGHSTGELACAYADGCCTAEQTMMSAFWRGKAVEVSNLPRGAMAAVGLTWEEALKRCPKGVYPACHNADDSITISGLKEPLEKFVKELTDEKVFARVVDCYGYAFHCDLVCPAANTLREGLNKIITEPKPRTARWLSTSYVEDQWEVSDCKVASAEYFAHNLISNVHFNEVLKKIPTDAIVIEIAPHHLLLSVLKRAIGSNATYLSLMKRNQTNVDFLLQFIGTLYTLGLNPKVAKLYPAAKYPVPRATPSIADRIKWNHSISWEVPKFQSLHSGSIKVNVYPESKDKYLLDHCIEGRSLFPATGYIYLAWNALAKRNNKIMDKMSITIHNFKILRAVILNNSAPTQFYVYIGASGNFEILESNSHVATGNITFSMKRILTELPEETVTEDTSVISGEDIYNELKIYGYEYGRAFQGLIELNMNGLSGLVAWNDRWIPYLDSLLLFCGVINKSDTFALPIGIQTLKIDPVVMKNVLQNRREKELNGLPVKFDPDLKKCISAGIEIINLEIDKAPHRIKSKNAPILEQYTFVPYNIPCALSEEDQIKYAHYISHCNEVMKKIASSSEHKTESLENGIIEGPNLDDISNAPDDHVLLKTLHEIMLLNDIDNTIEKRSEILGGHISRVKDDMLYNTLVCEKVIRIALDIITENSSRNLNLCEIHTGLNLVAPMACKTMFRFNHKKFINCTIASSDSSSLAKDILTEFNIELQDIQDPSNLSSLKKSDIVVSSFLNGKCDQFHSHIKALTSVTQDGGFILLFCKFHLLPAEKFLYTLCDAEKSMFSEEELEKILQKENLSVVSKLSDSFGSSFYVLRNSPDLSTLSHKVIELKENELQNWVNELKTSFTQEDLGRIWVVAEDSTVNGVIGLVNCLNKEPGGERIRCVFNASKNTQSNLPSFSPEDPFYIDILKRDLLMNVYKDGHWGSFRHFRITNAKKPQVVETSCYECERMGDLSSFRLAETPVAFKKNDNSKEKYVHIYYSALNFRDIMIASGKLSGASADLTGEGEFILGFEFSGRENSGKRVMGLCSKMSLGTNLLSYDDQKFDVPDHWTLEEAATVPMVYLTSYYALIIRGNLQKGESILIHSGTGGVGQASIRLALSLGCEIFTTVGTDSKREYLKRIFPQIKDENIGCSRDTTFEDMIKRRTCQRGVDVVLNSLADDKLYASLRCVARHGRFLEIGKYDMLRDSPLGLRIFLRNINFCAVCMEEIFVGEKSSHYLKLRKAKEYMIEGIKTGVVKPLDRTLFSRHEMEKAFRHMTAGTHVGKTIIKMRDEEPELHAIPKQLKFEAIPITYFYKHKVYIVVGGLGGFGIELAKWLAKKGAHNIILTTRYGARTPYHHLCLKRWEINGLNVIVSTLNVGKEDQAKQLLQEASVIGPVGGIFNSALVLNDAFIENQTPEYFDEVCEPKATATKYLDKLSRSLCPMLDYFVCFSSISCGKGNAGQSNYGYANSVMERICEERVSLGLHGLAIQWGIIGDVGIVHRHIGDDARIAGVQAQSIKSCLETLDTFCRLNLPVVSSHVNAEAVKSLENSDDVLSQIAKIFGHKSLSEVNMNRKLSELGLDSLVAIEVKHLLENHCETTFSILELSEMTVGDLKELVEKVDSTKKKETPTIVDISSDFTLPESFISDNSFKHISDIIGGGIPVCFISLGDNDLSKISALGEHLRFAILSFQCTKDTPMTDIPTMAKWFCQDVPEFPMALHLVGYKLGVAVAIEIAAQASNRVKSFTIIDGSASLTKILDKENSTKLNEDDYLVDFVSQFIPGSMVKLHSELTEMKNLEQKVEAIVKALTRASGKPSDNTGLKEAVYAYLRKRHVLNNYSPKISINNDITVIEASSQLLANEVSTVKTLLSKVCSGKINIHRVATNNELLADTESIEKVASILQVCYSE